MKKTIGFFGDSFCATRTSPHSIINNYTTYIQQLADYYDAKIVNLGKGGSSVQDLLLTQLQPLIDSNSVPDICVFVWTDCGRLYHPVVRNINGVSSIDEFHVFNRSVWKAAKQYYTHLYDYKHHELAHKALLLYIDTVILTQLPKETKIVHLWSFGSPTTWDNEGCKSENISYCHDWKTGVEIRPALVSLSLSDRSVDALASDKSANHLEGKDKNNTVFEWIRNGIDNV